MFPETALRYHWSTNHSFHQTLAWTPNSFSCVANLSRGIGFIHIKYFMLILKNSAYLSFPTVKFFCQFSNARLRHLLRGLNHRDLLLQTNHLLFHALVAHEYYNAREQYNYYLNASTGGIITHQCIIGKIVYINRTFYKHTCTWTFGIPS